MDFAASSTGLFAQQHMKNTPPPTDYLDITTSFMYPYKMLFTMDSFNKSIEDIKHSQQLGTIDYTHDNIKQTIHIYHTKTVDTKSPNKALPQHSL